MKSIITYTAAISIILVVLATGCRMSTPLSPGELAVVHEDLEGTSNCTKCHTMRNKVTDRKCMDCHEEISRMIENGRGYHASEDMAGKHCYDCHSDHHGRNFEIVHLDTTTFDHDLTGYMLEGSHSILGCKTCHQEEHMVDTAVRSGSMTYLGLAPGCLNCHADIHQGTLNQDCLNCHDQVSFRPATAFTHTAADYQLSGAHESVECEACHQTTTKNGVEFQRFTGLEYQNCTPCHQDIHGEKLGDDCATCHNEGSFLAIQNRESFDHELTGYSLEGRHKKVDCYNCHINSCTEPLSHANCYDCHEDYHEGDFTVRGRSRDCAECHDLMGFKPSGYTLKDHHNSNFPLTGAHRKVDCYSCHQKGSRLKFKNIGIACIDCHADIHENFISARFYPDKDCRACHNPESWLMISFDHAPTGFPLTGGHAGQACRTCHFGSDQGHSSQQFSSLDQTCINCHSDIHYGQFEADGSSDCLKCHTYENWQASKFNHDNTNFRLDGKHSDVACLACHIEVNQDNRTFIKYKIERYRCEDCH